jgi:leucyl-tRNA synthetase
MSDFSPDGSGRSPLARVPDFMQTVCPGCGGPAHRETDTMGGFACSSWYFLRFTSPNNDRRPFDPDAVRYWMPVDLYVGGAEHAVLHLLYARFWTRVMADEGLLPFREPFSRLVNQGQLLGFGGQRMSKSRGNVVTPDSVVAKHGADALRVFSLFMAPFDQDVSWSEKGIAGARRFLDRVWNLYSSGAYDGINGLATNDLDLEAMLHRTIRKVTERIEGFRFNTMISALMEFVNYLYDRRRELGVLRTRSFHEALEVLPILLAPSAPHIAEELWELTGHTGSVHQQSWPEWDSALAFEERVEIPIQIDGKIRQLIEVSVDLDEEEVLEIAHSQPVVRHYLDGREVVKHIYVPGKILSIATRPG